MSRMRLPNRTTKENAFTLIELMVAILILGILTAIGVSSVTNQTKDGIDMTTTNAALFLKQAADELNTENASHPASRITMEAILGKHGEILKHAAPGTVLAIASVDYPTPGYCIATFNPKGKDFIESSPYVLDSLQTPAILKADMDPKTGACPAGVLTHGLPNKYVVNDDGTITPKATPSACDGLVPGPIKQDVRYNDGAGNVTPVSVDLLLSDDCSHVTGTLRVTNADKGDPNAVYTLPVSTQTMDSNRLYLPVANSGWIQITGAGSAQVNLSTGWVAGQNNRALFFDPDYRTAAYGGAFLVWQR